MRNVTCRCEHSDADDAIAMSIWTGDTRYCVLLSVDQAKQMICALQAEVSRAEKEIL